MAVIISAITPLRAISQTEDITPNAPTTFSIFSLPFSTTRWSISTDKPVPADYDDSRTETAVYRSGIWYIVQSLNGRFSDLQFGLSGEIPIAGIQ